MCLWLLGWLKVFWCRVTLWVETCCFFLSLMYLRGLQGFPARDRENGPSDQTSQIF